MGMVWKPLEIARVVKNLVYPDVCRSFCILWVAKQNKSMTVTLLGEQYAMQVLIFLGAPTICL